MEGRKEKAAGLKSLVGPLHSFIPSVNESVFSLLFLCRRSSLFVTILKLITGWVGGEGRERAGGNTPVCSSGFGSIWEEGG